MFVFFKKMITRLLTNATILKNFQKFFFKIKNNFDVTIKLKISHILNNRILSSRIQKNDIDYKLRINAGDLIKTKRNVILQINIQIKNIVLKNWLKKQKIYIKFIIIFFNIAAANFEIETQKILNELKKKIKINI